MAKRKLTIFLFSVFLFFSNLSIANPNIDQWLQSEKSYKDLINEGFEVKSYAISDIEVGNDLTIILFVTVLQKDNEVYECQEYQTIDKNVETLDMNLICKELVQPYERGIGTQVRSIFKKNHCNAISVSPFKISFLFIFVFTSSKL